MAKTSATSRRAFLGAAGAAGAGVAVSAVSAVPAFAGTPSAAVAGVVITTVDPAKGTFLLNVGERSLSITDLEFASKIAKAIA
jgi:uncharacterized protein (DUF1501 family)